MFSENLPVVMYEDVISGVNAGQRLEVVCVNVAAKNSNQYSGGWIFYLLGESDGKETRYSFIQGRSVRPRRIKTLTGLFSFALELGISPITIPHLEGQSAIWQKAKTFNG